MPKVPCPVSKAAELFRDLPAFIADDQTISYHEYDRQVASATTKLKGYGVTAGERVAIVSANRVEYPILLMALFRIGAVACPISPCAPQQTIANYVGEIRCHKVVDFTRRLQIDQEHRVTTLPASEIMGFTKGASWHPKVPFISLGRDATIIATSGSSAQPKAVLHTFANHFHSAVGSNKNIRMHPGDRWLLSLPLYHVGGLAILFRAMLGGGTVVMADGKADMIQTIRQHKITHLSVVHTQLYRLLQKLPLIEELSGLKALLVGGSAIPAPLITQACECGWPLFTTYGLTEMASQVTTTSPDDPLDRLLTSGRPLEHCLVKISNQGEILVKGKALFRGYVKDDEIVRPVDGEGWFHTGDMGDLDSAGYLRVEGRKDNMFISGGENVHPEEIESTLCLLESISEAVVVPVEDDEFGFRPVAIIRTKASATVCRKDLLARLEQSIPRFKIPIRFYQWPVVAPASHMKPPRRYYSELVRSGELTEFS